jgi:hypothetical protein
MTTNIFEYASRNKLRFTSLRGVLTVEQLWDVPLRSTDGFNLNAVARAANEAVKAANEENFVGPTARTTAQVQLESALEIVKYVIDVKLADEAAAKKRVENKAKREKLLVALQEKEDGKLSEMSVRELKRQIAELEE